MRVKNKKRYLEWKKKNEDEYGKEVFEFAERWADLMEVVRAAGRKIEDVYEELSDAANINGITGAMYYIALKILVENWEYGDELKVAIMKNDSTESNLEIKNTNDTLNSTVESILMSDKKLELYILSDKEEFKFKDDRIKANISNVDKMIKVLKSIHDKTNIRKVVVIENINKFNRLNNDFKEIILNLFRYGREKNICIVKI